MTATIVDPRFTDPDLVPVGEWMPARHTRSLTGTEDFTTDADRLLAVIAVHWRTPEGDRLILDPWQVWLLRHLLEVYPPDWPVVALRGQLRFRQAVISVARQNGKSVLAAILAFYFLTMHVNGPRVLGLASRDGQAKIVYDRVRYTIDHNPALERELKATATRGITRRNGGGIYQTMPAKEESAQGEPVTGGIYDELHLGRAGLWDAIVLGARSKRNALLAGFTTAGDADSDLLLRLYDEGDLAIKIIEDYLAGTVTAEQLEQGERFGFFCWEAADDDLTEANLIAASPAIACGRVDLATAYAEARKLDRAPKDKDGVTGRDRRIRYVNNRFLEGSANSAFSGVGWKAGAALWPLEHHTAGRVFTIERTEAWEWSSITATSRREDGIIVTELIASLEGGNVPLLAAIAEDLHRHHPGSAFGVDRATLKDLGKVLAERGLEVWQLTADEMAAAAAATAAAIARRKTAHPGDRLVTIQMAQARRRDLGDSWRLSRSLSTGDIDTVIGLAIGTHIATVREPFVKQIF